MVPKYRNEYPNSKRVLSDNSHNWPSETLSSLKQVLRGGKKRELLIPCIYISPGAARS